MPSAKPLPVARIAEPCDMAWNDMRGDDRKRACERCGIVVHNLSDRPRAEAEALLERRGRQTCFAVRQPARTLDYAPANSHRARPWVIGAWLRRTGGDALLRDL